MNDPMLQVVDEILTTTAAALEQMAATLREAGEKLVTADRPLTDLLDNDQHSVRTELRVVDDGE